MPKRQWTDDEIRAWIDAQGGSDYWYQRIPIRPGIVTPGTVDPTRRLQLLDLPGDLSGKTVLDIGCNSGQLCILCKQRGAQRVLGLDLQVNRLKQARTLAEILDLEIEYLEMDLFRAPTLGRFDLVFCVAVLTEVADLIGGLEVLKRVVDRVLFLELATMETFTREHRVMGVNIAPLLDLKVNMLLERLWPSRFRPSPLRGVAQLRRIESRLKTGWSLVPDRAFLDAVMGDAFRIDDLGMSSRYTLFRLTRVEAGDASGSP